jgi:uncharacterized protein
MKIVLAGGTGQLGALLQRAFSADDHGVIVLGRRPSDASERRQWDGRTLGDWAAEIDGADAVINLAGRTVNCRYTEENLRQMMDSRVDSTRVIGQAIAQAERPPPVWLQMTTATIYAHRFDAANDEATGIIGGDEPDAPAYWKRSIEIAQAWEATLDAAETPQTRKVALRAAMVMSPDKDGVFDVMSNLVRVGMGGTIGGGRQYVSWIHGDDFLAAVRFLIDHPEMSGPVNLAAPGPMPQREFQAALRSAWGVSIGLPATAWMAEIGAFFLRTDTELILKSRRVVPGRLLEAGFGFAHPSWPEAAQALVAAARG